MCRILRRCIKGDFGHTRYVASDFNGRLEYNAIAVHYPCNGELDPVDIEGSRTGDTSLRDDLIQLSSSTKPIINSKLTLEAPCKLFCHGLAIFAL